MRVEDVASTAPTFSVLVVHGEIYELKVCKRFVINARATVLPVSYSGSLLARANTFFTTQNTACSKACFYNLVNWVKIHEYETWWVNFLSKTWVNFNERQGGA